MAAASNRYAAPARRNGIAASLANPCFRAKSVRAKAGKGSYRRTEKHKAVHAC